jgi:uncharacterized protein YkwD
MKKSGVFRRFVTLLCLVLLLSFPLTEASASFSLTIDEQHMLDLLNQERVACGLSTLKVDPVLTQMARAHSQEMIDLNYFAHNSPVSGGLLDRIIKAGVSDWLIAGENLAGAPTAEIAHNALVRSPSHYANMLTPGYTHVGIGVLDGGPYGKMFTQEFAQYTVSSQSSQSTAISGDIFGRVTDLAGKAIPGTAVRIDNTVVPTNANGEFRFTLIVPGVYTIYYDAPGCIGQVQEQIVVGTGNTATPPTVIMSPAL